MKKSTRLKIELFLVLALIPILAVMIIFHESVFIGLSLIVYANMLPLNVVFAPGINFDDYDGGVILNCLHGGGCPPGVSLTDDTTGNVIPTQEVPKKSTPVPETPGLTAEELYYINLPDKVRDNVAFTDIFVYLIYGSLIILLIVAIIILIKRRRTVK